MIGIFSKHSGIGSTYIQAQNILNYIKKEMMFFEATQKCPKALKKLKNCLDTFPPSSLEAEDALVLLNYLLQG